MDPNAPVPVPINTPTAVAFGHESELVWAGLQLVTVGLAAVLLFTGTGAKLRSVLERLCGPRGYLVLALFAWTFLAADTLLCLPLKWWDEVGRWATWKFPGFPPPPLPAWLAGQAAGFAGLALAAAAVLWIPYGLIAKRPRTWCLWITAITVPAVVAMLLVQQLAIAPMTTRFEPLAAGPLKARIESMAARCGLGGVQVLVGGNDETVVGLGSASRILVPPQALAMQNPRELQVTVAHELKHYRMGDNWLAIAVVGGLILAGSCLVQLAGGIVVRCWGRRLGVRSLADPAALPLIVLILALAWPLAGLPIYNAVQRRAELEADRFALELTHDNHALAEWQATVARLPWRLADYDPVTRLFLATHPSDAERIRFANAYHPWREGRPGVYDKVCRPTT